EPLDRETLFIMLDKVDSNVDRANRIITHMRMFARKTEVRLAPVQVQEVLERAFDIFNQQLKVRGIEVVWELASGLPPVMVDPGRLEQVFINLLINARDAIEEKWASGEAGTGEKRITIRTGLADGRVRVTIKDTGTGIPKEHLGKVFDPFFTTKEVGKGTGLGLSISYGIVKDCGGDIRACSDETGACFILDFPVRPEGDETERAAH
ncbi:MAG: ATP-binding protein, partial [Thermodesulfobacteriota bacterium]